MLAGSLSDICLGRPTAYMGHKVSCPLCNGTYPLVEGVLTTTLYGKGVAVAGMKTACGATLVATQFTDTVEWSSGASGTFANSGASAGTSSVSATAASTIANTAAKSLFDEQIQLVDTNGKPLAKTGYQIITSGGAVFQGTTDSDGKTQRVATTDAQTLHLYLRG